MKINIKKEINKKYLKLLEEDLIFFFGENKNEKLLQKGFFNDYFCTKINFKANDQRTSQEEGYFDEVFWIGYPKFYVDHNSRSGELIFINNLSMQKMDLKFALNLIEKVMCIFGNNFLDTRYL